MSTARRAVGILLGLLALFTVMPSPVALAAPAQAQITINNTRTVGGTAIPGAVYTATKTATIDPATGAQTPVTGAAPVQITAGQTTNLDQYSVYSIVQTTRAPGYYLNTTPFTAEFPLMAADGTIAADQNLVVNPKLTPVTGDASLTKYANGTTTVLPGATFDLYRTADANGAITPQLVTSGLVTDASGVVSATGLTEGQYYFVETAAPAGYAVDTTTHYPFTITVDATGTATAPVAMSSAQNFTRPSASTVSKTVRAPGGTAGAQVSANVGSDVEFVITVQVPADIREYQSLTITDSLDARFTNLRPAGGAGYTATAAGQDVTITLDPATVAPGATLEVVITAAIAPTATGGDLIPNTANVTWNNGQGDNGAFATSTAAVNVTEGSVSLTKVDGDTNATLAGATFVLTDGNGNTVNGPDGQPLTATSAADGTLTIARVPFGTYQLRETNAPAGYRLPTTATSITIDATTPTYTATVKNYKSTGFYPNTGTLGPWPYFIGGAALIGLFFLLWRRRRDDEDEQAQTVEH